MGNGFRGLHVEGTSRGAEDASLDKIFMLKISLSPSTNRINLLWVSLSGSICTSIKLISEIGKECSHNACIHT